MEAMFTMIIIYLQVAAQGVAHVASEVSNGVASKDAMTALASQVPAGILLTLFLQYLKTTKNFPVISEETEAWVMKTISVVAAAFIALGIHYTYDHASGDFQIGGNIHSVTHAGWAWMTQYGYQETVYRLVKVSDRSKLIRAGEARAVGTP